ncbi:MAG: hypothetical protein EBR82_37935 [Caulobacteraceae bacterium]|nr:hypothetical protein [Caulobacteraceae bacterium]
MANVKFPQPPAQYDRGAMALLVAALETADRANVKKDEEWNPRRLVLKDTVTGTRYVLTVASGALVLTAV